MQLERGIPEKDIDDTLTFLLESGFIHLQGGATVRYAATKLGQACCAASVDPDVALEMYSELSSAYFREQSLLQHELHLMYLILLPVPAKDLLKTDGLTYLDLWDILGEDMKQVGTTFGLDKGCIVAASTGSLSLSLAGVYQRFYTALALYDLHQEETDNQGVANKFRVDKPTLRRLHIKVSTFAGMVAVFCRKLGWTKLVPLFGQFQGDNNMDVEGEEEEENTSSMDPQENMDFDSNGSDPDEPTVD